MKFFKKIIPAPIFNFLQPFYHRLFSALAVIFYGRPSRKMVVIGVTGTNGKTSAVEFIFQILREADIKAASVSSLYFRIGDEMEKNMLKMTMPGKFFLQKFLRRALNSAATHAVLEITSEGVKQFRHKNIDWDILVLTNITPEHIESHGSFEKYRAAKEKVFAGLSKTFRKPDTPKTIIVNIDDPSAEHFLKYDADKKITYSKNDAPKNEKLLGEFNLYNLAAAVKTAEVLGIPAEVIKRAAEKIEGVPGRMEFIQHEPFAVIVDYAHTPDALRKVYEAVKNYKLQATSYKLICVLGSAGGGRDKWKRPEMGKIAAEFCDEIILTNEDPYDENPAAILEEIAAGFSQIRNPKSEIRKILDRREAIERVISDAKEGNVVIITGKGAEPWMMGPNGQKIPWDDREIAREALRLKKPEPHF
ncbi:MAG: UDP-N-acetylmuramoyl-L-alanyl-D-glutamate--2,6-diaminopimelate ligase [Candidatus Niyogibacteria bacterium]|nr:MAG: UDP-N-acetylmuramoyl-L-alanyl-D-glutamate--2,6-diaminopimelate ligase [Candidatus Niyogibacteria bacterium]